MSYFAMPKSSNFSDPVEVRTMFDGVTSRWITFSGAPSLSRRLCT